MAISHPSTPENSSPLAGLSTESVIWDSLKQAIATSSGFQRWQLESGSSLSGSDLDCGDLDYRVRRYLRETLQTLAY